jgi:hypothetical protein
MRRSELDQVTRNYRLSESAVALALDLTGARPDAAAWNAFALRVLHGAGLAALAAGAIFFVAANWQAYGVVGRRAMASFVWTRVAANPCSWGCATRN